MYTYVCVYPLPLHTSSVKELEKEEISTVNIMNYTIVCIKD